MLAIVDRSLDLKLAVGEVAEADDVLHMPFLTRHLGHPNKLRNTLVPAHPLGVSEMTLVPFALRKQKHPFFHPFSLYSIRHISVPSPTLFRFYPPTVGPAKWFGMLMWWPSRRWQKRFPIDGVSSGLVHREEILIAKCHTKNVSAP